MNAAFTRFMPADAVLQAAGTVLAWGLSLLAGDAFFRWVELRIGRAVALFTTRAAPQPLGVKG